MGLNFKTVTYQFLLIIGFLLLPYLFMPHGMLQIVHVFDNKHTLIELIGYVLMLFVFFLNYYYLVPKYYLANHKWLYASTLILFFFTIVFLQINVDEQFGANPKNFTNTQLSKITEKLENNLEEKAPKYNAHRVNHIILEILHKIVLYGMGCVVTALFRLENMRRKMEKNQIFIELSALKSQINPHFLYNTLNNVYALTLKENATKSSDSILKLSNLFRYVLTETNHDTVPLIKEIENILNYIELQKLRLDKNTQIQYDITGLVGSQKVIPMVFFTFIENAFKYGVSTQAAGEIKINLHVLEERVNLIVENQIQKNGISLEKSNGLGIENTKRRLDLLYPGNYSLECKINNQHYYVNLNIPTHA